MPPAISVIIPVYNGAGTLGRTLDALDRQTFDGDYEVLVVDDGSTDATAEIAAACERVRVLRLPTNQGRSAARNAGIEAAGAPRLAFTDADCVPAPDWLEQAYALLDAHPIVCGSIGVANPDSTVGWSMYFMEFVEVFPGGRARAIGNFTTANVAMRRAVFDRGLRFDTRFWAGEDRLLAQQLRGRYPIHFAPALYVGHLNRTEAETVARHAWRLGESSAQIRRHAGALSGSFLLRWPALIALTPCYRTGRLLWAVLTHNRGYAGRALWLLPRVFALHMQWARGFYSGATRG